MVFENVRMEKTIKLLVIRLFAFRLPIHSMKITENFKNETTHYYFIW